MSKGARVTPLTFNDPEATIRPAGIKAERVIHLGEKLSLVLDLNILLDVVQRREPFYATSAALLAMAFDGRIRAFVPSHVFTTLYYIVRKSSGKETAESTVDRLLSGLEVAPSGIAELRRARSLAMADFEDAVIASSAEAASCDWIITRNVEDFGHSPVPAVTPVSFLIYRAKDLSVTRPE